MIQVVVNADQAKLISEAHDSVEVIDENGNRLGYLARPFTDEDIQLAKQRLASGERRYTTAEVLDHLRNLEQQG